METTLRGPDSSAVVPAALLDVAGPLVYFPVRHHSPACAALLRQFIQDRRPAAVLIEGPSDFNERIDELHLPHTLPIAVYSYVHLEGGSRRGAFYPFCEYSPEWQALLAARQAGCPARFIDLPWAELAASADEPQNRYSDAELRYGRYVKTLCRQLGVEDFDAAWDVMIEQHQQLTLADYFQRCHTYCCQVRQMEETVSPHDERREACMARHIHEASAEFRPDRGPLLVITGGFHCPALLRRVEAQDFSAPPSEPVTITQRGIAITPYSYERLDSLRGYEAGMPNPGFYHQIWRQRSRGERVSHHPVLSQVIAELRKRGQTCSTADCIALETMAQGLALIRGRDAVWREDLVDAITSALVKEELDRNQRSPFLEAVYHVFRGEARGRLAENAILPPLVVDIRQTLHELELEPTTSNRDVELELTESLHLIKSRVLHRLRLLGIAGFRHEQGTNLATRDDLSRLFEVWSIRWYPEFDAACIESARYGATLAEAATAQLLERAAAVDRDAEQAALLLLDSALAGCGLPDPLLDRLAHITANENDFLRVISALGHLLYLYRYDEVLGTQGTNPLGTLLGEVFTRAVWLLEKLGQASGQEAKLVRSIRTLVESFELAAASVDLNREELIAVLSRVQHDRNQLPMIRGAAAGGLANLGAIDATAARKAMFALAQPTQMGDFLAGLFGVAREMAQRDPELVGSIDELLTSLSTEDFLAALPSFRLAFTFFTPREKHHLLTTLFRTLGILQAAPLATLEVDMATAAEALALEGRIFAAIEKYGLRTDPTPFNSGAQP